MGVTVDIDNGGTFTDGYFTRGDELRTVKVDTTPHDLTVCFLECLREGAKQFGYSGLREFLRDTQVIRYSTTVGTNAIIQGRGPRLGLIVTAGHECDLYDSRDGTPLEGLVGGNMVRGVADAASDDALRASIRELLDSGARVIVVSLEESFTDPSAERRIKNLLRQEYPNHYLGAVPVLLASEVTVRPGAAARTNAAVINAFLHKEMVRTLYKADEDLRADGYYLPLLIAHANGGAARVAKTKAIDTYSSGPVAGLMGAAYMAKLYGLKNVVSFDIGGTSTDVGIIAEGAYTYNPRPLINGMPINLPCIDIISVGGGGSSIARVDPLSQQLTVGPDSAGAMPGPVCYDLGGVEPTATDADVVLGYIDADYFLGGRRRLNRGRAVEAIQELVAGPLRVSVEDAAQAIRAEIVSIGATAVAQAMAAKQHTIGGFSLFAFGGAGGSYCAEIGAALGIDGVYTFAHSSVFSAMGLSTADVLHHYERAIYRPLDQAEELIHQAVADFEKAARRDMRGEGFAATEIGIHVELELNDGSNTRVVPLDTSGVGGLRQALGATAAKLQVQFVRLTATGTVPHNEPAVCERDGREPSRAWKGMRPVYREGRWQETAVYERGLLRNGNMVVGPAVVEGTDSTYVVPAGFAFTVDQYLNAVVGAAC